MVESLARASEDDIARYKNYQPTSPVRFVTATSLFDGHDASINIMRRVLQSRGAEVVHLGHNRSAQDVVTAALQEDAAGVAVSCYQGGHVEYYRYIRELLDQAGAHQVQIFGGGGGVISAVEKQELESTGINRLFSPAEGHQLGLDGMIGVMLVETDRVPGGLSSSAEKSYQLARAITQVENGGLTLAEASGRLKSENSAGKAPVLGITGTGGAGKSSLTDELLHRFLYDFPKCRIGVVCVDPTKKSTSGALLGDRIRVNACSDGRIFLRSLATRSSGKELSSATADIVELFQACDFDLIIVETSGIGQGDSQIVQLADRTLYVMTPEFGANTQLEKIDMLDLADLVVVNKYERGQGLAAVESVRHALRRGRFKGQAPEHYPLYATIASRFNDDGTSGLYRAIVEMFGFAGKWPGGLSPDRAYSQYSSCRDSLIPASRATYLADISETVRSYHQHAAQQVALVQKAESFTLVSEQLSGPGHAETTEKASLLWQEIDPNLSEQLSEWTEIQADYSNQEYVYHVKGREVRVPARFETLAHSDLPRVALPQFISKADLARYFLSDNLPGRFPFTGGIFPFRRRGEDPKRQFAGEGGPKRTNERFHYLSKDDEAKRLSTAFDSVTLYGSDPASRPDIFGKVGESGVSIATLEDMKELYAGFDLCSPTTSVSMTINGPAPIILAMFLNTAVDQQVAKFEQKEGRQPSQAERMEIFADSLRQVRGTVQADILKEDQAQNTCIFSTEFSLKLMADVQRYFIEQGMRNYYAVSISGYHIAEAGANPITQLAFTLANGFTFVEYYLASGMDVDEFGPNLAFFFSNGLDAEYGVFGRVARRIWAVAMRDRYGANERVQKLKYHIQTSGRSLHAQEMSFNDIRTTLQALIALYDNCNSLHTNAFDEAYTTPSEHSVRQAMAIQKIINEEFGPNKCENINQGSFYMEQLTDLVEEAVLAEFERISQRGGVLGAMELQYQRNKIQEESLYYEELKHSGELPIVGVNTFLAAEQEGIPEPPLTRSSYDEKNAQIERLQEFKARQSDQAGQAIADLKAVVLRGENVFAELMKSVRVCSLQEISDTLYEVGGKYRRAM